MPNCYYYDEQRNRCNCYANESLNELLAQNAKLRELVRGIRTQCLEDECRRCHEWVEFCEMEDRMHELGIEVGE